jgi:hypothetical protein
MAELTLEARNYRAALKEVEVAHDAFVRAQERLNAAHSNAHLARIAYEATIGDDG